MSQAAGTSRFLDLRALAALQHLRFTTRRRIDGVYSGRHASRHQGGAGEFADYREYVNGEDLRRLDWKVLARSGRAYTRLYQDETNLHCMIVVDGSSSMSFAGGEGRAPAKLEWAQYFATALSELIYRQQDQVGIAIAAAGLRVIHPPGGTRAQAAAVQEAIARIDPQPATNLGAALRDLFPRIKRRGVLVLLSDFLVDDLDDTFAAVRLFRHRHWDVLALHLVHPEEERLPVGAAYRFEGLENEGRVDCSPAEVRRLYEQRFEAHSAMARQLAYAAGCDYRRVSTATPYLATLGQFLVERAG